MARLPPVDPTEPPSGFKRPLTTVAVSKPGTWFYINVASRFDPWIIRATRGRLDSAFGAAPILLLTVRGAKTGIERTVPLLHFTQDEDVVVVASSFGRPRHPAERTEGIRTVPVMRLRPLAQLALTRARLAHARG